MEQKGSIYHWENLFFRSLCYSFASIKLCKTRAFISGPCQECDWIINTHTGFSFHIFPKALRMGKCLGRFILRLGLICVHAAAGAADPVSSGSLCWLEEMCSGEMSGWKLYCGEVWLKKTLKWSLGEMWDLEWCELCFRVTHEWHLQSRNL